MKEAGSIRRCTLLIITLLADTELRLVVLIFASAFSAVSARSSACSKLCCTFRYLAKLTAASSSYLPIIQHTVQCSNVYLQRRTESPQFI